MYYAAPEPQLKPRPPLIDKKKETFVCGVKRLKPKTVVELPPEIRTEFRNLDIGEHFRLIGAKDISPAERAMTLRKVAVSSIERNAQVTVSFSPHANPVGQVWTIDPLCHVQRVDLP